MEWMQEQSPVSTALALETVREWTLWLTAVARGLLPHCARREARPRAWASLRGVRSPAERQNSWQLAEGNGDAPPYGGSLCGGVPGGRTRPSARPGVPLWWSP